MKYQLLFIFLFIFLKSNGQDYRLQLKDSKFFYAATLKDEQNVNKNIQIKELIKDTIIANTTFQKFKITTFEDYLQEHKQEIYFESYQNQKYIKLDEKLKPIHSVDLTTKKQSGILFGEPKEIIFEYVDTRTSYPRDSLVPTDQTPIKFFSVDDPQNYIVLLPDFKTNQLEMYHDFYTKQLFGESIFRLSKHFDEQKSVNNEIKNKVGDEIQLVFRRKWYNEKTGVAEYEDKQFKNFKYLKDSLVNGQNSIVIESEGFNFLSGFEEQKSQFLVLKNKESYSINGQEIAIKNYGTEMKILPNNSILIQSVIDTKIANVDFPVITQFNSASYYTNNILMYFPMSYLEVGNVEGSISYAKINGKEYGTKRSRVFDKSKTSIWSIDQISDHEIEIKFYVLEKSNIKIGLGKDDQAKSLFDYSVEKGENQVMLKTDHLISKKYYNISFEYETENNSGSSRTGFTAK